MTLANQITSPRAHQRFVDNMGITRWNPQVRAGAIAIRSRQGLDAKALHHATQTVGEWARYQNLSGDLDTIEPSPIQGTYDWRSYLQEESQIAQRREERKPREKKTPEIRAPAPSVFYA